MSNPFEWKSKPASKVWLENSQRVTAGQIGGKQRSKNLCGQTLPGMGERNEAKTSIGTWKRLGK